MKLYKTVSSPIDARCLQAGVEGLFSFSNYAKATPAAVWRLALLQ
jgi:hypothetical protein